MCNETIDTFAHSANPTCNVHAHTAAAHAQAQAPTHENGNNCKLLHYLAEVHKEVLSLTKQVRATSYQHTSAVPCLLQLATQRTVLPYHPISYDVDAWDNIRGWIPPQHPVLVHTTTPYNNQTTTSAWFANSSTLKF